MAITGPWVGGSAVTETGQRWMSNAARQVRLDIPFLDVTTDRPIERSCY